MAWAAACCAAGTSLTITCCGTWGITADGGRAGAGGAGGAAVKPPGFSGAGATYSNSVSIVSISLISLSTLGLGRTNLVNVVPRPRAGSGVVGDIHHAHQVAGPAVALV